MVSWILTNPAHPSLLTVRELAKASQSSLSAFIRLCHTLQFKSYVYSSRLTIDEIDDLGGRLEDWEFEGQQGVELGLMAAAGSGQTADDRLFERPKLRIIPPMEAPPVLAA